MNPHTHSRDSRSQAFTLIELLIVIAIIGILAGLIFAALPGINKARTRSVARAELNQLMTAIESYKAEYGSYPQDNTNNPALNPLYFELSGMIIADSYYWSLDRSYSNSVSGVNSQFRIPGLLNASESAAATDDRGALKNFLGELKPTQVGNNSGVRFLVCSATETPWNYVSSNPTNSPGTYDLWVDIDEGSRTNKIGSWIK